MPTIERRLGVPAARGIAILAAVAGAAGATASGFQTSRAHLPDAAVRAEMLQDLSRNCGDRAQRFEVERAQGGTRVIEICNAGGRDDLASTSRALSLAIDAAPRPSKITSDPRMLDLLSLRLMRARTDMDIRMDADARIRKLAELDQAIKALEEEIASAGPD